MPYTKKAPAKRTKKAIGGALGLAKKRMLAQKKAAGQKRLQSRVAKAGGMPGFLKQQRAGASKRRGLAVLGQRQKAAVSKQNRNQSFSSLSKSAQARLIKAQEQAFKTGRSSKSLENSMKKYGSRVSPARAKILMGLQSRGIAARKKAATKKAPPKIPASMLAKMKGRSGQRVVDPSPSRGRGRVYSTTTGARKAQELAKMRGRSGQRVKRPVAKRGRPSSRMQRAISTFARGRATARPTSRPAASRRRTGLSTAAAARRSALAARRRRAVASRTRIPGRPSLRRPVTRRRTYRR